MTIRLNGKEKELSEDTTLAMLVESLGLNGSPIVAEVSGKIIPPGDYAQTALSENCVVELIRFVGGG